MAVILITPTPTLPRGAREGARENFLHLNEGGLEKQPVDELSR
jgi:hypothetical protein